MNSSNIRRIERKIYKRYRNLMIIWLAVAFIVGMFGGVLVVRYTGALDGLMRTKYETTLSAESTPANTPQANPSPVPAATATTAATVTTAATATPTAVPVVASTLNITTINLASPSATVKPDTDKPSSQTSTKNLTTPTAEPMVLPSATIVSMVVDPTLKPLTTVTPTPKPTNTPMPSREDVNTVDDYIVPYGLSYTFETEILSDGYPRYTAADTDYDTAKITVTVQQYLSPEYYALHYANQYRLKGDEAGVEFTMSMTDVSTAEVIDPQNAFLINFVAEDGTIVHGYKLMDAAIAGKYNVTLSVGDKNTYYKRFSYSEDMGEIAFMQLIYYQGGQEKIVYFSLIPGAYTVEETGVGVNTTYPTLQRGDSGSDVRLLQLKLIEEGFMEDEADSQFGRLTEEAVKLAQKIYGMKETGIADDAFQQRLFSE